jgi:flagellar basal body-associated protein FliL
MRNNNYKPLLKKLVLIFVIILVLGGVVAVLSRNSKQPESTSAEETAVSAPIKTTAINQTFTFPIGEKTEEEQQDTISYMIENAEIRKEIIVQGKKAAAIEGRAFLILTLKLTNTHNVSVEINTKDYVRLGVGETEERLAPDINNDPVTIQPISTKNTRVAFPVNESDIANLTLYVGEIKGDKQEIDIVF